MNFIKYFLLTTAFVTAVGLAIFYLCLAGSSFIMWTLPNFYWSWDIFRGSMLFGMFIGACVAIGEVVGSEQK